jgi:NAD(P)-dependent dehydrogenase (short-subunit alcohol dehydrogenase family)
MTVLDMFSLDGKVAVVTGASSGLGVAFARALAEVGADVALGARRADRLEETKAMVESLGRRAIAVATDVATPEDCETEMTDQYLPGYLESMIPRVVIRRAGRGEEIAATLVWLVSEAGGYVTGQSIIVDGGVSLT